MITHLAGQYNSLRLTRAIGRLEMGQIHPIWQHPNGIGWLRPARFGLNKLIQGGPVHI